MEKLLFNQSAGGSENPNNYQQVKDAFCAKKITWLLGDLASQADFPPEDINPSAMYLSNVLERALLTNGARPMIANIERIIETSDAPIIEGWMNKLTTLNGIKGKYPFY